MNISTFFGVSSVNSVCLLKGTYNWKYCSKLLYSDCPHCPFLCLILFACWSKDKVIIGVAYDCVDKMVYWTDISGPSISRASLHGGEPTTIIRTGDSIKFFLFLLPINGIKDMNLIIIHRCYLSFSITSGYYLHKWYRKSFGNLKWRRIYFLCSSTSLQCLCSITVCVTVLMILWCRKIMEAFRQAVDVQTKVMQ